MLPAATRHVTFVAGWLPAAWLAAGAASRALGPNALESALRVSGRAAIVLLLLTLALTPARRLLAFGARRLRARRGKRLSDWNALMALRRQLGLFAFFYASLHLGVYLLFDAGLDVAALRDDLGTRPFVAAGALVWLLLAPLAVTSNRCSMRTLGRRWRQLHRLVYLAVPLAVLHEWMQGKTADDRPWTAALLVALLLGSRLWTWRRGDSGEAVPDRSGPSAAEVQPALPSPKA